MNSRLRTLVLVFAAFAALAGFGQPAQAQPGAKPGTGKKPNILVIWGDDIGITNISHYNKGLMGYKTPNIDRSPTKGSASPTTTGSRAALPAGRRSSAA